MHVWSALIASLVVRSIAASLRMPTPAAPWTPAAAACVQSAASKAADGRPLVAHAALATRSSKALEAACVEAARICGVAAVRSEMRWGALAVEARLVPDCGAVAVLW